MLQYYCPSLTSYQRLPTKEVKIGDLLLGNNHPIRIQTMTTTDSMDTDATVAQAIRCIEAGAELVRITAPSKNEAENLLHIKNALRKKGYTTPLVADIHFTPNAAEIAARIVEKVRVNPGNYIDKKKFDIIEYTDAAYAAEVDRIRERFTPLVNICKEYGTAMRIGTNHGSLSDRIMSRYGDTPIGMVESALEFLRIARGENYHQIVLSMKSSNPLVMVEAYRLLVQKMDEEFGECYPLHLGVTEAGDGEDGRIKSAIGIGSLLEDGIGDTIRVSLTEDPEFEIPVCKDIVKRYTNRDSAPCDDTVSWKVPYDPFNYKRRESNTIDNIGGHHVPIVIAHYGKKKNITPKDLEAIGYHYDEKTDKWNIADIAADYLYTVDKILDFPVPGSLKILCDYTFWRKAKDKNKYFPVLSAKEYMSIIGKVEETFFVYVDSNRSHEELQAFIDKCKEWGNAILCIESSHPNVVQCMRWFLSELTNQGVKMPIILVGRSRKETIDEQLVDIATNMGALMIDGFGDGIVLINEPVKNSKITGRTYMPVESNEQFLNNTAFSILQATRTRISKTEYISCPSCGRTLFDLQEVTAKIRSVTHHLKGVKIAIMGCIVNGPGEMADADFGYVGSGPGKITLYRGKEVVKRNVPSEIAVDELIQLLKDSDVWVERTN